MEAAQTTTVFTLTDEQRAELAGGGRIAVGRVEHAIVLLMFGDVPHLEIGCRDYPISNWLAFGKTLARLRGWSQESIDAATSLVAQAAVAMNVPVPEGFGNEPLPEGVDAHDDEDEDSDEWDDDDEDWDDDDDDDWDDEDEDDDWDEDDDDPGDDDGEEDDEDEDEDD